MLTELARVVADRPDRPDLGELAARMRALTLAIAFEPAAWTPERIAQMIENFDAMAVDWRDRDRPERHEAIRDALTRGGPFPSGLCLEVGAGTGNATGDLRAAFAEIVSLDLSQEMLVRAEPRHRQVRADASRLPVPNDSAAVVALINMFLFPAEVDRVLQPDGVVVWVSTNGAGTPIYLSPAEVLDALPGTWAGVSSEAGWGSWLTARRAS